MGVRFVFDFRKRVRFGSHAPKKKKEFFILVFEVERRRRG